ncbi:hypothetical protein HS088_TW09G00160 [Tripterygium wilfordii]|uniref:Uncharacterized protein n=1 Tax=Tripterygium wilfordii TaxID=458696 RepID=A0A7J7D739_TRIWF|nr:hypothetical protein HS088_TW09G00160 [Tripterygium wilfordii]
MGTSATISFGDLVPLSSNNGGWPDRGSKWPMKMEARGGLVTLGEKNKMHCQVLSHHFDHNLVRDVTSLKAVGALDGGCYLGISLYFSSFALVRIISRSLISMLYG